MAEVKRYSVYANYIGTTDEFVETSGEWVKYEDYQSLTAERDRLREALLKIRKAFEIIGNNSVITTIDEALKESEGKNG